MGIQNCYNLSVPISKMVAMAGILNSNNISRTVSPVELKIDGRHQGDMDTKNSHGGHLDNLQTISS